MLCLFLLNLLSSETWMFASNKTCLKVKQGSYVLVSGYCVVIV